MFIICGFIFDKIANWWEKGTVLFPSKKITRVNPSDFFT
jgi:hypothetical protein